MRIGAQCDRHGKPLAQRIKAVRILERALFVAQRAFVQLDQLARIGKIVVNAGSEDAKYMRAKRRAWTKAQKDAD